MKEYLVDGNNLIHKISYLAKLQKTRKQDSREKLSHMLDRFFAGKNVKVFIYFDGHENLPVNTSKVRIFYSGSKPADLLIREHIEDSKNPRNIIAVSSDDDITKLAKACSAETIKSEDFAKHLSAYKKNDDNEKKIDEFDNEEFKRLFGAD